VTNNFIEQVNLGHKNPNKCVWNCLSTCNYNEAQYFIAQALFNAAEGKMSEGFAFAGANAYRISEIQSVSEVINELVTGYSEVAVKNDSSREVERQSAMASGKVLY
jgi:nitronate monooxygenase